MVEINGNIVEISLWRNIVEISSPCHLDDRRGLFNLRLAIDFSLRRNDKVKPNSVAFINS
ncbi:hypothetical protein BC751_1868 [Cecembia calidifontis]|uniref:Uncharacterized protein n=1 Tax=Cecembia calidifontis TaxID=1187080 RepID=A0A4Q7P9T9_9BACT|nr:hypothetical protein BC751_1868 [Cecembia calidifontis]